MEQQPSTQGDNAMDSKANNTKRSVLSKVTNSKKKKQYLTAFVILFVGIALFSLLKSMKKPPEEKPLLDNTPLVSVMPIAVEDKTFVVSSYGVVEPKYDIELTAQVSGVIVELSPVFVRGGFVKKGELLARIDPSDYQAALLDAQSMVAAANASLEKELAQGKVAEQEWKEIKGSSPTTLSLRKPQLAQEQAKLKAAKAALMRAKRNLQRSEITAPFDAIVAQRMVGLGSFVGTGAKVGKILNTDVAQVRLPIPDRELRFLIDNALNANVTLTGNVAGKEVQWQASITRNEGVIDNVNRMHYLVAELNDPYYLSQISKKQNATENQQPLRFGAYVNAEIDGLFIENVSTIARQHFVNNAVPVYTSNGTLALMPAHVIRQEGANLVVSGNVEGDSLHNKQLVTTSLEHAVHGMKLLLTEAAEKSEVSESDSTAITTSASAQ